MAWILFHPPDEEVGTELSPPLNASPESLYSDDYIFFYLSDGQKRNVVGDDWPYWTPPIELNVETDYTWYCEHYNVDDELQSTSPTWSFTTAPAAGLPGKPTNPSPIDTGTNITLDESPLSWDASDPAADTYEVYFRIQGAAWGNPVGESQAEIEWAVTAGLLGYTTTYEWRVDATNIVGTTTGNTWSFGSITFDQLRVSYVLISGGSGAGPYDDPAGTEGTDWAWTGENNMLTVKRLVVAAESKIWYEDI